MWTTGFPLYGTVFYYTLPPISGCPLKFCFQIPCEKLESFVTNITVSLIFRIQEFTASAYKIQKCLGKISKFTCSLCAVGTLQSVVPVYRVGSISMKG